MKDGFERRTPTRWRIARQDLQDGIWSALVEPDCDAPCSDPPDLAVSHGARPLSGIHMAEEGGAWKISAPLPLTMLSEGNHTLVVSEARTGAALAAFHVAAGQTAGQNVQAQIDIIRAELDLLVAAFRRAFAEDT